jgi:hypothetical protein
MILSSKFNVKLQKKKLGGGPRFRSEDLLYWIINSKTSLCDLSYHTHLGFNKFQVYMVYFYCLVSNKY